MLADWTKLKYGDFMLFSTRQQIVSTPEIDRKHLVRDLPSAQIDGSSEFKGYDLPPSAMRYSLRQLLPERPRVARRPSSISWLNPVLIPFTDHRGSKGTAQESVSVTEHQDGAITIAGRSAESLGLCYVEYSLPPQNDIADWPDVSVRANAHYYEHYNHFSRPTHEVLPYADVAAGMGFLALVMEDQTDDEFVLLRETELFITQH